MPWLETAGDCEWLPAWLVSLLRRVLGLRASPRLLVAVCSAQLVVLVVGMFQQMNRTECQIAVPAGGPVVVECDTCIHRTLTLRGFTVNLAGAVIICSGIAAVLFRNQRLLAIYSTCMLFFSGVIGLVAVITSLEGPMLEVAVSSISSLDEECIEIGEKMLENAHDHASLAALGCLIDALGAVLAIRSKELFSYEEIASNHAEVTRAQSEL
jgi:hypothetical protein